MSPSEIDGYALHNRGLKFRENLNMHQNHLEDLLKHGVLDPAPEFLSQEVQAGPEKLHF